MTIEPKYVTFDQAKKLKERGFNVKCEAFYNEVSGFKLQNDPILRTGKDLIYECPEHWQVIAWLEEVHGIWVSPDPIGGEWYWTIYKQHEDGTDPLKESDEYWHSSTEAYSAAFDYILDKII